MDNERGIFGLTIFKKITDNLVLNEYYEDLDSQMSDSNIGGRKKRMAKDHLFIIYGVINDVVNGDAEEVDIQVWDIEKAFDKLSLRESVLDVVDNIPEE